MDVKSRGIALVFFLGLSAIFPLCFSKAIQRPKNYSTFVNRLGSSAVFQVQGNVYPTGHYIMYLRIGDPPKFYDLDIDSGSDLTWVQCDAPCVHCTKPRDQLYKPHNNAVKCGDPICAALHSSPNHPCPNPNEQCDYEVEYADHGSSLGVLVQDFAFLPLTNGSVLRSKLAFGCGYDQRYPGSTSPPVTAGVLGLGNGKTSIISQLHSQGLSRNVFGHCFSSLGGGLLFLGDNPVPSDRTVWIPMSSEKHYISGPADLLFNGKPTAVKGIEVIFDSGSSYTYFNSQTYKTILDLVINDLKGKQLNKAADPSLPFCWKGAKPFKSVADVKNYFNPLALIFTKARNAQLNLPPEAYLIVSNKGNVCFGILNGTEIGLENLNIIGDISLLDKMVIYDNEKQQIGWAYAKCTPKSPIGPSHQNIFFPLH